MIVPARFAASIASCATSGVVSESAQKIPPVWNQRTPSCEKISSQSISPGFICEMAVWPRSEQPRAARIPNPRSVKFRPLRTLRPTPSNGAQRTYFWLTPPCSMRSSNSRPMGLSASAVTTAVSIPKQRLSPRATLYSPPPSHTRKWRVVEMRSSPGSRRNITSPRLTKSHVQSCLGLTFSIGMILRAHCIPVNPSTGGAASSGVEQSSVDRHSDHGIDTHGMEFVNFRLAANAPGGNKLRSRNRTQPADDIKRDSLQQTLSVDVRVKKSAAEGFERPDHINCRDVRALLPALNRHLAATAVRGEDEFFQP